MVLHGHHSAPTRLAVVSTGVESGARPTRVLHFEGGGFTVFDDSVVVEDPERYSIDDFSVVCEACLIDQWPELGRGLDVARECGESRLVAGSWEPVRRQRTGASATAHGGRR